VGKTGKSLCFSELPKEYRSLCNVCIARTIREEVGYENTLEIVEAMAGFEDHFSRGQSDYFVLLTDLISAYEDENEDHPEKAFSFRQRLQHLLQSAKWSASDLGRFLDLDATMGNKILREERKLTADHIRRQLRSHKYAITWRRFDG
jgi:antitoxin component HigA of HigAB toxin-antitoxin module